MATDGQFDADIHGISSSCRTANYTLQSLLIPMALPLFLPITFLLKSLLPPRSSSEGMRFENHNEESAAESATRTADPTPSITLAPEGAIPFAPEGAILFAPEEESITAPEGATPSPSTSSIPPAQMNSV